LIVTVAMVRRSVPRGGFVASQQKALDAPPYASKQATPSMLHRNNAHPLAMHPGAPTMRRFAVSFVATIAFALGACSASGVASRECNSAKDCASGVCRDDGTCTAAGGGAAGTTGAAAGSAGASGGGDAGASGAATGGGGAAGSSSVTCTPNQDGTITRAETPLGAGLSAKFRIAPNVTLSTAGVKQADGSAAWDFSPTVPQDHDALLEALPLAGAWYAAQFPGASYAMRLSDAQDLLGVFEITGSSLLLRGVVSPTSGASQTELVYSPPATVLQFPLKMGASWTTQSTVSGTLSGIPATYFESYQEKVDQHGLVKVPFGTFPVLRISVVLTQTVGALLTVRRSYLFSTECFGTIAKMIAQDNEASPEFSNVKELSRLAP
jgi:hypothetical protein